MSITLLACIDMNNGIGTSNGELLFDLPKDMKHFKSITSGKHIIMGRNTWDSLPIKPLKNRKNYILSKNMESVPTGAKLLTSIDDVLNLSKAREVFIIGGGEIYNQFLPYADKMIITHVHAINPIADVFFPNYELKEWKPESLIEHEIDEDHEFSFTFATYKRKR